MTAACETFTRAFAVGPHRVTLAVTLVADVPVGMTCEWEPLPRRLSKKRRAEYVRKRDAALAALATRIGGTIAVAAPGLDSDFKLVRPETAPGAAGEPS